MDGDRRDPRIDGANLFAAALASLGGALALRPEKVFAIAGAPLSGDQARLLVRMLGLRDSALAYLLFKQRTARGRRTVLAAIGGMAVVEATLLGSMSAALPWRARLLLTGSTGAAALAAGALATSGEDAPAGGAELLIAGYALAAPMSLELVPIVRRGQLLPFLSYTAGAVAIGAGWLLRRNPPAAVLNFTAAAGGVAAWLLVRRRQRAGWPSSTLAPAAARKSGEPDRPPSRDRAALPAFAACDRWRRVSAARRPHGRGRRWACRARRAGRL